MKNKKTKIYASFLVALSVLGASFILYCLPVAAAEIPDEDSDGLNYFEEVYIYHTDPTQPDTDGDSYGDGMEVESGYSPRHPDGIKLSKADSDNDGLPDSWEIAIGADLLEPDSDNDGHTDGVEVNAGYDPLSPEPILVEKLINVDLEEQKLSYYFNNIKLEEFLISSGISGMLTPKGQFMVLDKVPSKDYGGQGFNFYYPDTKWNLHFTTGRWRYYIHGAYWHNNFGHPMSHGCVNVAYENMEALYDWADTNTKVMIF